MGLESSVGIGLGKGRCNCPCQSQPLRGLSAAAVILLAGLFFATPASAGPAASTVPASLPTITTARQAHSLSSEQAARGFPIHISRAVVTYYDPSIGSGRAALFVHDATAGIYAELTTGSIPDLAPGTLLDIRGVSGRGEFAPIIANPQLKIIGHGSLPANPRHDSLAYMLTGADDTQWVEAEGLVHSVVEYGHVITLRLAMPGGTATVIMVKQPGADYTHLVDAKVSVRANAAPRFNTSLQMIGVRLACPGLSSITVVDPPVSDPFLLPVTPVDKLLRWNQVRASFHRVHLRGRVTLQWPGSAICIRDSSRGICAQTLQTNTVAVGDDVDVVGFAAAQDGGPVLTDAFFKSVGTSGPVTAAPITAEEALLGQHDSELIQVEGHLIGKEPASSDTTLLLSSGKIIFAVALPSHMTESDAAAWQVGSNLRVTGICSLIIDAEKSSIGEGKAVPEFFRVRMRSPRDVAVLSHPPWWTAGRTFVLLALVLTCTLAVLGWVVALRKRVNQQTSLLRQSEERFRYMALHDALTGVASRILLLDRLNIAVETSRRHGFDLAVMMLDVDKFKEINDTFGHSAGDQVLRVTAERLVNAVRKSDTVARMGGDEFVVLLPGLHDSLAAEKIAANLVVSLSAPISFAGHELPVSVSIGVCSASDGELDADTLIKNADKALYHAKASGRNGFRVHTPEAPLASAL